MDVEAACHDRRAVTHEGSGHTVDLGLGQHDAESEHAAGDRVGNRCGVHRGVGRDGDSAAADVDVGAIAATGSDCRADVGLDAGAGLDFGERLGACAGDQPDRDR